MRTDPDRQEGCPEGGAREARFREVAAGVGRRKVPLLLGLGVGLRLIQYGHNRSYWMDEASLVANVRGLAPAAMFGPLAGCQLAPPGFLIAEWAALHAFGDH